MTGVRQSDRAVGVRTQNQTGGKSAGAAALETAIEFRENSGRACADIRKSLKSTDEERDHQRRGHAFAADIADRNEGAALFQRNNLEEIAPNLASRFAPTELDVMKP